MNSMLGSNNIRAWQYDGGRIPLVVLRIGHVVIFEPIAIIVNLA